MAVDTDWMAWKSYGVNRTEYIFKDDGSSFIILFSWPPDLESDPCVVAERSREVNCGINHSSFNQHGFCTRET